MVLEQALKNGIVQRKDKNFEITKFKIRVNSLFSKLQILGAVGYYEGGPEIGINVCLEGLSKDTKDRVNALETRRKEANRRLLGMLYRDRLKETRHIQWFDAGSMYVGMGVKVIGQFCSFLSYKARLIKPNKYILGFVDVPPEIPGWGHLKGSYVKVSVRVPKAMQRYIEEGKLPAAIHLLREASRGFGVADGHAYAASCILPADMRHVLIKNAEKVIQGA